MMKKLILLCVLGFIILNGVACTSSQRAQYTSFNSAFRITVWSGGKPVKEYISRGKVHTESESDGWYFSDKETGALIRISGTVTMEEILE